MIVKRSIDITWAAISRVDCIDQEMLRAMRMAGCIQISFGVESGSKSIRDELNKKFSEEQIHRAFALTASYGILTRAYIIYGCPGESLETVKDTIRLLKEIRPLVTIFHVLSVFPGTFLYDLFKSQTGATDDIWLYYEEDLFLFEIDKRLCAEKVSQFGKSLKKGLMESIPDFFHSLELVDDKELFPFHAGFLSRLALTLDRGDYPHVLPEGAAQDLARKLYYKALEYAPDARAYWGLGLLAQAEGDDRKAEAILREGMLTFPEDAILNRVLNNTQKRLAKKAEARKQLEEKAH